MNPLRSRLFITPHEVASDTGIGVPTVYAMVHSGELPSVRVGRCFRIPIETYSNWKTGFSRTPAAAPPGELNTWRIKNAADWAGVQPSIIQRLAEAKMLPAIKSGNEYLLPRVAFIWWWEHLEGMKEIPAVENPTSRAKSSYWARMSPDEKQAELARRFGGWKKRPVDAQYAEVDERTKA
jgi:excisionase family DNA binding protein